MTLNQLLKTGYDILAKVDISSSKFDSRCLLESVFSLTKEQLFTAGSLEADAKKAEEYIKKARKRASGYPLQYILGEWEFWGRSFKVGEGVLIPRPDTETLIEISLDLLKDTKSPHIIDLCSGSGCIAITLALEAVDSKVAAVELSSAAFSYLSENIKLNNASNVTAIKSDIFNFSVSEKFDLIVSNPPYIRTDCIKTLEPEVMYEPKMALDGTSDGLHFYREIVKCYKNHLKPCGHFAFEIGFDQGQQVYDILESAGMTDIKIIKDLTGNDRVITACLK